MAPPLAVAAVAASIAGSITPPGTSQPSGDGSGEGSLTVACSSTGTTGGSQSFSTGKGCHVNEDTLQLIECVRSRPALWHRKHLRQRVQVAHRGWEEIRKTFKATDVSSLKVRWKTLRDSFRREVKRIEDGEIAASNWPLFDKMSFLIGHFRTRESYYTSGSVSPEQAKGTDDVWKYAKVKHGSLPDNELTPIVSLGESEGESVQVFANTKPAMYEAVAIDASSLRGRSLQGDSDREDREEITVVEAYEALQPEEDEEMELETAHVAAEVIDVPPQVYGEVTFKNKLRARIKTEPVEMERKAFERKPVESDSDYNFLMSLHPFMRNLSGRKNLSVRIKIQQLIAEAMEEDE